MQRIWNVLIADDEAIIREGIRTSVDWERLGLCVVGEAEDGEQALELALETGAHILLVDLSMPIMNGLTLIAHVRERLPACKVVIVSGHDEFAYAQEAIKLEVEDYLLKPIDPDQLRAVLTRVRDKLEAAAANEDLMQLASKQIEKNVSLLRERFCLDWMRGDLAAEEVLEQLAFLRLPPEAPETVGVIRWPEQSRGKELYSERDRQLLLFAIENIVEELLRPHRMVRFRNEAGCIVVLVWGAPAPEAFARIEEAVGQYLKITVLSCFLGNANGLDAVPALYAEARAAVSKTTRLSPLVRRTQELIEERFADSSLTLEGLANELNVSNVYLSRLFKQESGVSFVNWLTHMRIKEAVRLLGTTELAIHEIAEQVGYETQHYFSTAFKKIMGVPPNQYRKQ